ncbi:hypothetical protein [Pseudanabaena sp. ABRG5-3]|uniref:PFE-CTERM domain-containing protein n=1 Tax=Pseudanabaena sp. ABRG5-3 TaxID=685565 RepID=UPI000DC73311|nr:hypothetical protein [Pseudanabaena sp. ABRG5-3]BBC22992.1 hypothetical protein ABRG53_0735 [Pseudanabaena sp. ABRG5-3]
MKNLAISLRNLSLLSGLSAILLNTTFAVKSSYALGLVNPNFENNLIDPTLGALPLTATPATVDGRIEPTTFNGTNPAYVIVTNNYIDGWKTTATDRGIEVWESGFSPSGATVLAAPGNGTQFAEVNATTASALYQDLLVSASGGATELSFDFWHRARIAAGGSAGNVQVNGIRVRIIDDAGTGVALFDKVFATQLDPNSINTTNKGWANYNSTNVLAGLSLGAILAPARGADRSVRFQFEATSLSNQTADVYTTTLTSGNVTSYNVSGISTTNSNLSYGNFLDNANLQTIPFDFSPNLGIGILGGLYLGNRCLKSLRNKRRSES